MKNSKRISILILLLTGIIFPQSLKWYTPAEGFAKAATENKTVLLDAYTEWCGWCKVMDTATYGKQAVIELLNKDFVCVKYNPELDGNITIGGKSITPEEFGKVYKISGYPATAFYTSKGEFIQTVTGYIEQEEFATKILPFILSGEGSKINYGSMKYIKALDEFAKQGMNSSLKLAYALVYFEVEGDDAKAIAAVKEIEKTDSLFWLAGEILAYFNDRENTELSPKGQEKIQEIVQQYLRIE